MDINQKYTDLLKKQIESIKKECRYWNLNPIIKKQTNWVDISRLCLMAHVLTIRTMPICILVWMMKRLR